MTETQDQDQQQPKLLFQVMNELSPVDFPTNAALYRYLVGLGFGTAENMWKTRYRRNIEGFRDLVVNWRALELGTFSEQVTEYVHRTDFDTEQFLANRARLYEKKSTEHAKEHQRHFLRLGERWGMCMFFTDLHLDDDGSNLPLLLDTIDYFNRYDNVKYASLADWANFWIHAWSGKMARSSHLTVEDALTAMHLLFEKMGDKFVVTVLGNHDKWPIDSIGYDFIEPIVRKYAPNVLYRDYEATVKLITDDTQSQWLKLSHYYKGGSSMWNPHQSNAKHIMLKAPADVNFTITGHFHWPKASFAEFPFENRQINSMVLGSIKSYDDYAQELGMNGGQNDNPFGFVFLYDGKQQVVTDIEKAKWMCATLQEKYG